MCQTPNLTVQYLAPDPHDNIIKLVDILKTITSHFHPSENVGFSAMDFSL